MSRSISISMVIPAKNEADNINSLAHEILAEFLGRDDFEIVYVDDGSTDLTAEKVNSLRIEFPNQVRLIRHEQSAGQSTAIYTGVLGARGKLIATLDADGQNDPKDINKLLARAETFVTGKDFCIAGYRRHRKDTAWKRFQSRLANKVRASLLRDDTPDTGCGLKIFPRSTFLKLPYFDHMHRYLPALIKRIGGTIEVIEVSHRNRQHGQSKYGMWGRLFAGIIDMCGVMWLQHRTRLPTLVESLPPENM